MTNNQLHNLNWQYLSPTKATAYHNHKQYTCKALTFENSITWIDFDSVVVVDVCPF